MRYTEQLLVDSPHWKDAKKHKDHQIAIDYFNRYNLPEHAVIGWQTYLSMVCIAYQGWIPDKDKGEKISKPDFSEDTPTHINPQIMLWKKFKTLNKLDPS